VLAEGSGFELRSEAATIRVDPSRPAACFSGDLALSCVLLGGAVRAVNLIVDRTYLRPSVEIWKPSSPRKRGSTGSMDARFRGHDDKRASDSGGAPRNFAVRHRIVVCLEGVVVVDGAALSRFDAALIEDAEITAASGDARAALLTALPVQ
jgi:environmental stress-induced protein Ves